MQGTEPAGVDSGFWRDRRVFVTGHTGFKGAWLCLWLQSMGAAIRGFSDGVPTEPSLYEAARVAAGLDDVRGDVRDAAALGAALGAHRPEVVIHMAAQPLVRTSIEDPRATYETNVMGTVNLFEAVRACDSVRAVVNVTSDKCYENRGWEWAYREYEPKGGHDPYSSSKACAELVTDAYRHTFFSEDGGAVAIASARAGNVIGGGDWAIDRLVPDLVRAGLEGGAARIRNPASTRPWQHVLCPLAGYLMLAQRLGADADLAEGWNFGPRDDDARPVGWIAERFAELWPSGLRIELDPGPHPAEASALKLDSSRARARLGWDPRWGLEQALEATVAWFVAWRDGEDARAVTLAQIERYTV